MSELTSPQATRLKAPSWLDGRLVVGVLLVLMSVVVGAKIIASSDRYDAVWAASRALAPGTTLAKSDLVRVEVRFKDHGGIYLAADGPSPAGRVTAQPLAAGQLIPLAAVPAAPVGGMRLVTVPVDKLHMPRDNDLHGVQVDLYVTPKSSSGDAAPAPRLVLSAVTIAATITDSALGGSGGSGVVLAVPVAFVDAVVSAAQEGSVDLVRVPDGATAPQPSSPASPQPPPPATPQPSPPASAAASPTDGA
jgi:hypothetical protein